MDWLCHLRTGAQTVILTSLKAGSETDGCHIHTDVLDWAANRPTLLYRKDLLCLEGKEATTDALFSEEQKLRR